MACYRDLSKHRHSYPLLFAALKFYTRILLLLFFSFVLVACGGGSSGGGDNPAEDPGEPTINTYGLSLGVTPLNAGSATGSGQYDEGEEVTVSTTPAVGYEFENWTDTSGNIVAANPSFTVSMDQSYSFRANYTLSPTVSRVSMPAEGVATGFEAANAPSDVFFAVTKEETFGDGHAGLWRTEDAGDNWSQVIVGGIRFVEIASGDPNLVIAGVADTYQISTDGGLTWSSGTINDPIFGSPISFNDASAEDSASGIYLTASFGLAAGLYKSTDLGANWFHVLDENSAGSNSDAQLRSVEVAPSDSATVYTSTGFDTNLWKSVNSGDAFLSIKPGVAVSTFVFGGGMTVDPGNADRLLIRDNVTVNGGANWSQVSNTRPGNTLWLDGDLVRFNEEAFEGFVEISKDFGVTWNRVLTLVQEDGSRFSGVDNVYLGDNAIYVERGTGSAVADQIFKVDLALLRSRIDSL